MDGAVEGLRRALCYPANTGFRFDGGGATLRSCLVMPDSRFRPLRSPALGLLTIALVGTAADWPQFLGPNRDGTSIETGLVDRLPTNGLPLLWEQKLGTGYSAPSVVGDTLVLFHRQGREERVEAVDAATGVPRWKYAYPSEYVDPYGYNNGPRCAPLLTTNRVFTFGAEGVLTCLELADGKKVWQRATGAEFKVPEAFFGVGSTPMLEGGRLLVLVGGQTNSGVVALDPATGKTLWESVGTKNWTGQTMFDFPGEPRVEWRDYEKQASYSSLITTTVHGRRVTWALTRQGLVALDPAPGAVWFSRWFRSRANDSVNAMTPLVVGSDVLISSAYYRSGSVRLAMGSGLTNYTTVWKGLGLEQHWSQPILVADHLYAFSGRNEPDAVLRCVAWADGAVKWERNESWPKHSGDQPPVFGRGSFIYADGKLIALGEGGLLGLFRPNPARCEELGRWQVPQLKHPCWSAPVLAAGRLYLQGEDRLVCFDARGVK